MTWATGRRPASKKNAVTMTTIPRGVLPLYVATPTTPAPWPGVVVLHDAFGMTKDLRAQTEWLAEAGYLAVAPDLFRERNKALCMVSIMRDVRAGHGPTFDDIEATRSWLAAREDCTGTIGVVGFCMGGGLALVLSPASHGFTASSVNYGAATKDAYSPGFLRGACPIVASFGADDRALRGAAVRLECSLSTLGIDHDVKEYPGAGHGFMNDHEGAGDKLPRLMELMGKLTQSPGYIQEATQDSRRRILTFFDEHLKQRPATVTGED